MSKNLSNYNKNQNVPGDQSVILTYTAKNSFRCTHNISELEKIMLWNIIR